MIVRLVPRVVAAIGALAAVAASAQSPAQEPAKEASESEGVQVELSGQLRERLTYVDNLEFDPDSPDNGWFLIQRIALTADVRFTDDIRARLTVQSGALEGQAFERIQRNDLDIQEAYLEFGPTDTFVRVGRQELSLGSQRLVATRDGTNLRRTWDGVRAVVQIDEFELNAFALSEVEVEPTGVFNDPVAAGDDLAGIYVTGPAPIGQFDAYFLYSGFDQRRTIEGTGEQDRYTVGARLFGESGMLFWNWEAIYQFGDQDGLDISAWSLATNTGLRFADVPWQPSVMLSANIASGDEDTGDGKIGTFDALFARGNYFSQAAILGPSNFYNINPSITAKPHPRLELFADVNFYWRLEDEDAIYGPPFVLLRAPQGSQANFVNSSVSAGASWEVIDNVELALIGTHSSAGRFIEQTGPDRNIQFLEFTAQYTF